MNQDNPQPLLSQLIAAVEAVQNLRWLSVRGRRSAENLVGELKALSDACAEVMAVTHHMNTDGAVQQKSSE